MKKTLSAILSAILAVCMLTAVPAGASATTEEIILVFDDDGLIAPFASGVLSSWTPILSTTVFGADITLTKAFSGTVIVEIHSGSGYVTGITQTFSGTNKIVPTRSRTTASGTYKIVIKITVNNATTTRESSWIGI